MQVFVDLDGVLADFDRGYREMIGVETSKELDNVDWHKVNEVAGGFYRRLELMPDALELWDYVSLFNPIVLSDIPHEVPNARRDKFFWVYKWFGDNTPLVTCQSRYKWLYCKPGDILIDDWEKYRHRWEAQGGKWITHVSASDTIAQLEDHFGG